ncbi:MAG: hypothetical protein GEU92_15840 [Alphaproteobacteria bacterium]|nr:hypothetical protein [Alphaproteobacteria bacterium]
MAFLLLLIGGLPALPTIFSGASDRTTPPPGDDALTINEGETSDVPGSAPSADVLDGKPDRRPGVAMIAVDVVVVPTGAEPPRRRTTETRNRAPSDIGRSPTTPPATEQRAAETAARPQTVPPERPAKPTAPAPPETADTKRPTAEPDRHRPAATGTPGTPAARTSAAEPDIGPEPSPSAATAARAPQAPVGARLAAAANERIEPRPAPSDGGAAGPPSTLPTEIVPSGQPGRLGAVLTQIAHLDRRLEDALKPSPERGKTSRQPEREADIFRHMAQAAQRGFPNAQYNFARMLIHGRGGPRDLEQAAQWLERSSERGYTQAQLLLGYIEAGGLGGKPDLGKAAFWWAVAERRGNKTAAKARELMNPLLNSGDIIAARRLRAQWQQVMSTLARPVDDPQDLEVLNEELRDAAETGDSAALLSALLQGADADSRDPGGRNAVINAAWRGRKEILEIMLSNGADTEAADDDGRTPLIWGAINGHQKVVQQLIDAGSNPNRADANGITALMRAAWNGHPAVVDELLRHGANPAQRDKDGKTALDHALQEGHAAIARRLQAAK